MWVQVRDRGGGGLRWDSRVEAREKAANGERG